MCRLTVRYTESHEISAVCACFFYGTIILKKTLDTFRDQPFYSVAVFYDVYRLFQINKMFVKFFFTLLKIILEIRASIL